MGGGRGTVWLEPLNLVEKKQTSREKGGSAPMGAWDLSCKGLAGEEAADVAQSLVFTLCRQTINDRLARLLSMKLLRAGDTSLFFSTRARLPSPQPG
jgi:hypothetical protein